MVAASCHVFFFECLWIVSIILSSTAWGMVYLPDRSMSSVYSRSSSSMTSSCPMKNFDLVIGLPLCVYSIAIFTMPML